MFTGIIKKTGIIEKIEKNIFTIKHNFTAPLTKGESVCISGMCATVIKIEPKKFSVEIMQESRDKTIFGQSKKNDLVNLERSMKIGSRNSGHFVLGHVDETGEILERKKMSDFELFKISISEKNKNLIVYKGSISVDGISLTVSDLSDASEKNQWFEISIISHTLKNTNLGQKKINDKVNIEFDILGKYILRGN